MTAKIKQKNTKKIKLAILGSCCSRDIFNKNFAANWRDYFDVVLYQFQPSFVSLNSDPIPYSRELFNKDSSSIFGIMLQEECMKDTFNRLLSVDPDVLFVDFYSDVINGVLNINNRSYIANREDKWVDNELFDSFIITGRLNPTDNPKEYMDLWEKGFDSFMSFMSQCLPETEIIINSSRCNNVLKKKDGSVITQNFSVDINILNSIWEKMDAYAAKKYGLKRLDNLKEYMLDEDYHFGFIWVTHYVKEYYTDRLKKLIDTTKNEKYKSNKITQNLMINGDFQCGTLYWKSWSDSFCVEKSKEGYEVAFKKTMDLKNWWYQCWSSDLDISGARQDSYIVSFDYKIEKAFLLEDNVIFCIRTFDKKNVFAQKDCIEDIKLKVEDDVKEGEWLSYSFSFVPQGKYLSVGMFVIRNGIVRWRNIRIEKCGDNLTKRDKEYDNKPFYSLKSLCDVNQKEIYDFDTDSDPLIKKIKKSELVPHGTITATKDEKDSEYLLKIPGIPDGAENGFLALFDREENIFQAITEINIRKGINKNDLINLSEVNLEKEFELCIIINNYDYFDCCYLSGDTLSYEYYNQYENSICDVLIKTEKKMTLVVYYLKNGNLTLRMADCTEMEKYQRLYLHNIYKDDKGTVIEITYPFEKSNKDSFNLDAVVESDDVTYYGELIKKIQYNNRAVYSFLFEDNIFSEKKEGLRLSATINGRSEKIYYNEDHHSIFELKTEDKINYIGVKEDDDDSLLLVFIDKRYPYIISVVMAVYNTEEFLGEAIDSVINQDIDIYKDNNYNIIEDDEEKWCYDDIIQLILVDDGSTDNSGNICDSYAEKYSWIKVIHKNNGGVCTAKNKGLEQSTGKYLNFFDSDDILDKNVIKETTQFLIKHSKEIDLVGFPLQFFDASTGDHWTNFRFNKGDRVVDLFKEWDVIQYFVTSTVFKTSVIKGKLKFDENLINGEDIRLAYQVFINEKPKLGLIKNCKYYYRRRGSGEKSAIASSDRMEKYYLPYLTDVMEPTITDAIKKYGFVPKYVQYAVMGQLQWRMKADFKGDIGRSVVGEEGYKKYTEKLFELLKYIDNDVIMIQKKLFREQKFFSLTKKTDTAPYRMIEDDNIKYYFDNTACHDLATTYACIEFFEIDGNRLFIEGYNCNMEKEGKTILLINGLKHEVNKRQERDMDVYCLGEVALYRETFYADIQLDSEEKEFVINIATDSFGTIVVKKDIRVSKFMPINKCWQNAYYASGEWVAIWEAHSLKIINKKHNLLNNAFVDYEKRYIDEIKNSRLISVPDNATPKEKDRASIVERHLQLRSEAVAFLNGLRKRSQIWLISDRVIMGGDNGEALFLYLLNNKPKDVDFYFAVKKGTPSYNELKSYGNVIDHGSDEYKKLFLIADCIISSHADEYVINPFYGDSDIETIFRDYMGNKKFVFLQHGITKDNVSNWLNRFNKNIKGFVTAAKNEYQSILEYPYFYTEKEVWLTGFPRYDRLFNDEKNYFTIMPTWRRYHSELLSNSSEDTKVKNDLLKTDFFTFYKKLLNDNKLLEAAENYGFEICFKPHPTFLDKMYMFDVDKRVKIMGEEVSYRKIYAESSLVMTDYSSSVFDFAYLRKPVVYCHFDKEDFFAGEHVYTQGYFDYEEDGFGEVTYTEEELVDTLIKYMKNGAKIKKKYKDRIDRFFEFNDKNNCKRVVDKLIELNK